MGYITFVSDTYLVLMSEVCIAVGCILAHMCQMLGLYTHLICWLSDLHMQCGSHTCSVEYAHVELMLYIEH